MFHIIGDITGVKKPGFHLNGTRIYSILVCISAILLLFFNIRSSMGKYEAFLLFGEKEKLISLFIDWTTASCAGFYFFWTIYCGITLKWKRLGLFILLCLLCIGYIITSIVTFVFFFDLREEEASFCLKRLFVSILRKVLALFILSIIVACFNLYTFHTYNIYNLYNPPSYYDLRAASFQGVSPWNLNIAKLSDNVRGDVVRAIYSRRGLDENYLLTDREEFLCALEEIVASTAAEGTAISMRSVNYKVLFDARALRFIFYDNVCYLDIDLNKTAALIDFSPQAGLKQYIFHAARSNEAYFEYPPGVSCDIYYTDKSLWDTLFLERISKAKPMGNCFLPEGPVLAVPGFKRPVLVTMDDYDCLDNLPSYRNYDKGRILDNVYIPLVVFFNIEPFPFVKVP